MIVEVFSRHITGALVASAGSTASAIFITVSWLLKIDLRAVNDKSYIITGVSILF